MSEHPSAILVVDDNETVRDLLSIRLETRGHTVETAADGRIALEKMRQHYYDLILLDIMMPEVNGYDVLETMQGDPVLSQIPVIILSALNDMTSVVRCVSLGAEDYLFKPINSALLWARLGNTLEKKHLRDREKARMAELSVLQKIDRELNTSLEIAKASEITLKWAVRQVDVTAGLVGVMADKHLQVTAVHHLDETNKLRMALTLLVTDLLMGDGRPQQQTFPLGQGLHPDTSHRLLVPIRRNGALRGLILLENRMGCRDSEVDFLERLSSHAALALNNAQLIADVQAANQAKSHFVSIVAHELKAPMTVINAYIDLVQTAGPVSDKQQKFLDVMRVNVGRMATLAADLSQISRIEAGKLQIQPTAVPIKAAIQEVNRSLGQEFQKKRQQVIAEIPADLPPVHADPLRLIQIITNLMSNAHKYTPKQGRITISARQLTDNNQPMIQVAVHDNGLGIDETEHDQVFSQFFRSPNKKVRDEMGTGLGLNITQKLIELHGGRIWFESALDKGSTFYFTLPISPL